MNINVTKIALYVLLVGLILFCGKRFLDRYNALMSTEVDSDPYAMAEFQKNAPTPPVSESPENSAENAGSNPEFPETAETNTVVQPPVNVPLTKMAMDRPPPADAAGIGLYVVSLFGLILGLGVLAAHDISTYVGLKTHKFLHNEEGDGMRSAAYEAAEEMWASGEHLESIRMMRDYLNKNPREVHVMIRIAEIYEKDLGNYLAAALEYEELLEKKLPRERWAWSAIHLVNLYFGKIDKPKQGVELLYRIHREYGQTAAAEKARKRLLQLDPEFQNELDRWTADKAGDVADQHEVEDYETAEESTDLPVSDESDSHLPKGFRKRK